jgi:small membrane protein
MSLNLFQIIAAVVLLGLVGVTLVAIGRRIVNRREAAFLCALWLAACVTVIYPKITVILARALGIGRGADLVSYCAVVMMMVGFTMIYVRLRRLRRELTLLVRALAIRDAHVNEDGHR